MAYTLKLAAGDPALTRLRDLYLEPWQRYASPADLVTAFDLASRVGTVNWALTWYQVVSKLAESYRSEHAGAVPGWLQEFLAAVGGRGDKMTGRGAVGWTAAGFPGR